MFSRGGRWQTLTRAGTRRVDHSLNHDWGVFHRDASFWRRMDAVRHSREEGMLCSWCGLFNGGAGRLQAVRTRSWKGPPRGKRPPRVGIRSTVFGVPVELLPKRARLWQSISAHILCFKSLWCGSRCAPQNTGSCGSEEGSYVRRIDFCITQL